MKHIRTIKLLLNYYSLQIQQLRGVLSHQADHVDPTTRNIIHKCKVLIITKQNDFYIALHYNDI